MMRPLLAALLLLVIVPAAGFAQRMHVDLNGSWSFRTDPNGTGESSGWPGETDFRGRAIEVPGAWQAQGVGEPNGALRHDYAGAAWYRRVVPVPADWKGKAARLRIGGAHLTTTLYVNGDRIGEHEGFSAPFAFDVSKAIRPGTDNVIVLRVANPGKVPVEGPREQTPDRPTGMLNYIGNWGGIYGNVALEAYDLLSLEGVYIRPDVSAQAVRFDVTVRNAEARAQAARVRVQVDGRQVEADVRVAAGERTTLSVTVPLPAAQLWSPAHPHLYDADISLHDGPRETDRVTERFGMREFRVDGNVLLLNGHPLYLRGFGDDNIEVLTGFPPASREVFLERLRQARAFGFNAVRFHSMTPPEEYFHAADEVGMLVMAELPAAYTQYVLPHRDFLRRELEGVLRAYRNRPSLLSLAFGNEFNLDWLETEAEKATFLETVADFYRLAKSLHPDGLILSNDGYVMRPTDLVSHYGDGLPDLPVVKHEFGEYYCSLPDISLRDRFTGVLVPEWLDEKKRWVEEQQLAGEYQQYVHNSQRLQHLGRKYQIERVRRRQDITGYHYWLIVDFPGGTGEGDSWEEGWFDYFWRPKGIAPADGQSINGAVVPLIDMSVSDRTRWNDEATQVNLLVSNYGEQRLEGAPMTWTLTADGETVASGSEAVTMATGAVGRAARITLPADGGAGARKLDLEVQVEGAHPNTWSFWSFPRPAGDRPQMPVHSTVRWAGVSRLFPFVSEGAPAPGSNALLITSALDPTALDHLRGGGRVWLLAERGHTRARRQEVAFFPAAGGALGTVVDDHPALRGFPHEGFGDLQFFTMMDGAAPVPLTNWPTDLRPIVGGIRTTAGFLSKSKDLVRVGYVFEARVGTGRLLVTSLRMREYLDEAYPEVVTLFDRLLRYAAGPDFVPAIAVDDEAIRGLLPPR